MTDKEKIDYRNYEAIYCEDCNFVCGLRNKKTNRIKRTSINLGVVEWGESVKRPGKIAMYCPKHARKNKIGIYKDTNLNPL